METSRPRLTSIPGDRTGEPGRIPTRTSGLHLVYSREPVTIKPQDFMHLDREAMSTEERMQWALFLRELREVPVWSDRFECIVEEYGHRATQKGWRLFLHNLRGLLLRHRQPPEVARIMRSFH